MFVGVADVVVGVGVGAVSSVVFVACLAGFLSGATVVVILVVIVFALVIVFVVIVSFFPLPLCPHASFSSFLPPLPPTRPWCCSRGEFYSETPAW